MSASKPRGKRAANAHQVSFAEGSDSDDGADSGDAPEDASPTIQANEAKTVAAVNEAKGKAHPGDIRRVLGNQGGNAKRKGNYVRWQSANHASITDHIGDDDSLGLSEGSEDPPDMVERPPDDESLASDDGQASYWGDQEDQYF